MIIEIAVMAFVGAIIGWFTNYLAIKLIFRPLNPIRIPVFGFRIQGLIPKRREELAANIGKIIEEQLLSIEELLEQLIREENKNEIIYNIKCRVLSVIEERIPIIVPRSVKKAMLRYIGDIVDKEVDEFLTDALEDIVSKAAKDIKIGKLVEDKINYFDLYELESIILSISRKELKHIEILGGVLGMLIGLAQGIIIKFLAHIP